MMGKGQEIVVGVGRKGFAWRLSTSRIVKIVLFSLLALPLCLTFTLSALNNNRDGEETL